MTRVPRAAEAFVHERKIVAYLLDAEHPDNNGKAAFFLALGFTMTDPSTMMASLRAHPVNHPVHSSADSSHGVRFIVRCAIRIPDGRDPCIRTIWLVGEAGTPNLVTAYP